MVSPAVRDSTSLAATVSDGETYIYYADPTDSTIHELVITGKDHSTITTDIKGPVASPGKQKVPTLAAVLATNPDKEIHVFYTDFSANAAPASEKSGGSTSASAVLDSIFETKRNPDSDDRWPDDPSAKKENSLPLWPGPPEDQKKLKKI